MLCYLFAWLFASISTAYGKKSEQNVCTTAIPEVPADLITAVATPLTAFFTVEPTMLPLPKDEKVTAFVAVIITFSLESRSSAVINAVLDDQYRKVYAAAF